MSWTTQCDIPEGCPRREYRGLFLHHALTCLDAGYEDNAASWMWRDESELGEFKPVKGTLRIENANCISYVDAADVVECLNGMHGDGI